MFTLDTDSGFRDVVFITSSYGLGETVVQGAVNPDEFYVYKPALRAGRRSLLRKNLGGKAIKMVYGDPGSNERVRTVDVPAGERNRFSLDETEIVELAKQALIIEAHYGAPMDIEWGKDGATGKIYILQARPETVQSRAGRTILRFTLKSRSRTLTTGRSIGQRIGAGTARIVKDVKDIARVRAGDRAGRRTWTDPDWEPVMKRAAAIVTNRGGRTCHAAIIAREPRPYRRWSAAERRRRTSRKAAQSPYPARRATWGMSTKACWNTMSAASKWIPCRRIPVKITMNVGNPDRAFDFAGMPHHGVGPRTPRIHHQPHDRRAPARPAGIRQAKRRSEDASRSRSRAMTDRSISTSTS